MHVLGIHWRKATEKQRADFLAVFEDMALKEEVFTKLNNAAHPDAILATNSAAIDIEEDAFGGK